jgi:hypothetical protein
MSLRNQPPSDADLALWQEYLKAELEVWRIRRELFTNCSSLVELVRAGLGDPGQRPSAIGIARFLEEDERKELFPDLLALASCGHGQTGYAKEIVLSLPKEWLLANIEEAAEPLLRYDSYEEYQELLEIYSSLDRSLAYKLAQRAVAHSGEDIKEAGQDFLERLNGT